MKKLRKPTNCGLIIAQHNFGTKKYPDNRFGILITMDPPIKEKYNKGFAVYPTLSDHIEGLFVPIYNGIESLTMLSISVSYPNCIHLKYQTTGQPEKVTNSTMQFLYDKKIALYTEIKKSESKAIIFSRDGTTFIERTDGKKNYYPISQVNKWRIEFSYYEHKNDNSDFTTISLFHFNEQVRKFSI